MGASHEVRTRSGGAARGRRRNNIGLKEQQRWRPRLKWYLRMARATTAMTDMITLVIRRQAQGLIAANS
jgi:hypothetical protein